MNARRIPIRMATIALLAATPIVAVACSDDDGDGGTTTIVIDDVAFRTPDVTVKAGDSVTWDNQDNQPHTASGEGSTFATDRIDPGDSATITFDEVGTFPYICSFHPFMTGTVTVE